VNDRERKQERKKVGWVREGERPWKVDLPWMAWKLNGARFLGDRRS